MSISGKDLAHAWQRYTDFFGEVPHGTEKQMNAMLELLPKSSEQPVQSALEKAAEILANFKGEPHSSKLEEWQACYAKLFTQMNELVNAPKRELLNPEMPAQELRLHMGELTANEVRVARAAIAWANSAKIEDGK